MTPLPSGRYLTAGLLLLPLLSTPAPADVRSPLAGIFSNVALSPESGDLGGLEIEIHPHPSTAHAFVVLCEGWCNEAHRVPVKINGAKFELTFAEPTYDASGATAGEIPYRVSGRLIGQSLLVDLRSGLHVDRLRLTKRSQRFGLDVAMPGGAP